MAIGAACGGTTSTLSSVSAAQACADAATAACAAVNKCSPLLIQLEYGDVQTCAMSFQGTCSSALAANGTGWTPAAEEACSQALPGESCADIVSNNPPSACQTPTGQLTNGVACGDGAQCQSKYCNLGTNGTCGACGTRSAGTCQRNADCSYGQLCVKGGCVAPGLAGSTCDATHPCNVTLACKNGVCAAPDEAGAPCTTDPNSIFGSCDELKALYCHALTRVCTAIVFAGAGQPCGLINNGLTVCSANGTCNGTCTAALAAGANCAPSATKDPCAPPATCSGGVCKLADPSMCK
jgi:hypothetical protein